ncbi:MAG: peptidase M48 [Acidobacteria bacterium]|jgi:STE24 endopeptidase|nr:peptidase M48 [Acidobacteriota bacterium]MDP7479502.1 M48 family metallopeptidase [Vicinamibacterales bacterium]HJN43134.1 M48 family metallopeptidase [Vicinamibacterales bacterium]|tara:strand:- start:21 stop:1259 length:1239 start_codon:yes stop_codon:yes gene_type:complete
MNTYALIVLVALLGEFALSVVSSLLNIQAMSPNVPDEFRSVYDDETYGRSQQYTRSRTRFGLVQEAVSLVTLLLFWQLGGFGWLDGLCRVAGLGPVPTGLLFIAALVVGLTVLGLPFRIFSTFVIEERFGFNRTTIGTFVLDRVKGLVLGAVLGGALLALVLFFFEWAGPLAWIWCWGAATTFMLTAQFVAPTWIMPLFNTFSPLESGDLKDALLDYARSAKFPLDGVFVIDGSRRSAKANAFFTGFGSRKRIALFDTLIEKQTTPELVAIVAHEVGHYKRRHILKNLVIGLAHTGALFWLLSLFLDRQGLFDAFGVPEPSVHAGLVFFGLLFTPIELVLSIVVNRFSRRYEFEADAFAADTTGTGESLITALKTLSADNLSNLTPHPLQVFLHHSHPPVLQRITALRGLDR